MTKKQKEDTIKKYMEKLKINRYEAEQLVEDDAEDFIGDEGEEMTKKAQINSATERTGSEKTKKRKPRERKVDEEKGYILKNVDVFIKSLGAVDTSLKTETELSFTFNDNKYTLKLTKHRPPKEV